MFNFKAEDSLVLIYQTQIEHQHTLLFDLLIPSIERQGTATEDPFLNDIEDSMVTWGKTELLNYGYISTYHLWEKQISHIIRNQANNLIKVPNHNFVSRMKEVLEVHFQITNIEERIWQGLEKARLIVNAYKHGCGIGSNQALQRWPELFYIDKTDDLILPTLEITEFALKELIEILRAFYERIADQTKLDFSNWS